MSKRAIQESPVEIGADETVPYTLTIPGSWGTATSPTAVIKNTNGTLVSGVITGISIVTNVISFIVNGTALVVNNDYRVEIKFNVTSGALEAFGIWQVRQ